MAESLTEQQHQAITTRDVSVALSAGAGCGKTFVLTQRFLSYLEPGAENCELGSLVAITFTERAAREMRQRIRGECARRLKTCADADVPHWMRLVRELDSARIVTIHSFCGTLLRSNAVEAKLDPHYALLDEMHRSALVGKSVSQTVRDRLGRGDEDIAEMVYEFGLDGTEAILKDLIPQQFRIEFDSWDTMTADELANRWKTIWKDEAIPRLFRQLEESTEARTILSILREYPPISVTARDRWSVLTDLLPRLASVPGDTAELLVQLNTAARVQHLRSTVFDQPDVREDVFNQLKATFETFRDQVRCVSKKLPTDSAHALRSAEMGLRSLRAARQAIVDYEEQKSAAGVLDFDDLLLRARNLLRDHPEVRRRAAAGISLLMVDEFQDTDPVQSEIVRMLCGDQLLSGRLFLVGDHKQSIYRFRRAEPKVFHELRQAFPEAGRLPLSQNFRSQPTILNFVNALFEDVLKPEYEPLVPSLSQLTPEPAIEFLFSVMSKPVPEAESETEAAAPRRAVEAKWIARRLHALIHDGVPRIRETNQSTGEVELVPVSPKHCVLLFRSMSDVRYYEEALRAEQLDCYVVGGHAFYAQQEVYDVVNLCRFLDDPDDQIALLGILRSPLFSVSDDGLYALTCTSSSLRAALIRPLPEGLDAADRSQIAHAARVLNELREQKDRLPLSKLLELAISLTGYDAALLAEFLGERKLANLRKLVEMARQFDQGPVASLADFAEQLRNAVGEESKESLAATHPESSDVIRLMTIHQAKGLEFPVVVVVDMDRQLNNSNLGTVFDPRLGPLVRLREKLGQKRENSGLNLYRIQEEEESLQEAYRLLYVATTRASSLLLLSGRLKKEDMSSSPWMQVLLRKFDIQTGQPRLDVVARHSRDCPQICIHHEEPQPGASSQPVSDGHAALPRLRELIAAADPDPLPESLNRIEFDASALKRFSVSQIEAADENLESQPAAGGQLFALHESATPRHSFTSHSPTLSPAELSRLSGREPEFLGTLVHGVLERLDFAAPPDVDNLVDGVLLSLDLDVSDVVRETARRCVRELLSAPLTKELAEAKQIHREMEFLLHWPGQKVDRTISGTIDCVYESAQGEWILLDYKTRALDSADDAQATLDEYEIQLGIYCLALKHLFNRLPDRVELVLIRRGVQRIGFQPTQAFVDEIARRVDLAMDFLVRTARVPDDLLLV